MPDASHGTAHRLAVRERVLGIEEVADRGELGQAVAVEEPDPGPACPELVDPAAERVVYGQDDAIILTDFTPRA